MNITEIVIYGIGKVTKLSESLASLLWFIPGMLHAVYIMASRPPGLAKLSNN